MGSATILTPPRTDLSSILLSEHNILEGPEYETKLLKHQLSLISVFAVHIEKVWVHCVTHLAYSQDSDQTGRPG